MEQRFKITLEPIQVPWTVNFGTIAQQQLFNFNTERQQAAWSTGGNLNTARYGGGAAGIQSASFYAGVTNIWGYNSHNRTL